jgi:hypothetical protein
VDGEFVVIPLLFIALGLGAVAAYEFSARTHTWVDEHARVLRDALIAHRVADAHLSAARAAEHPAIAVQHAHAATTANRMAAQKTAVAAETAKTEPQRAAAVKSATLVLVREDEIADTVTDAHLGAAATTTDPIDAVEHVHEAAVANQASAQKAATAAVAAQTEQQRTAAAQSAAKVVDRENKIAAASAKFGAGQCGVRLYSGVTSQKKDTLLAKLHGEGMTVTGDNPWDIDTHTAEVKLRAAWDSKMLVLKLIVASSAIYAPCSVIWDWIEPKLREVIGP